jgi:hypothetical protein
MQAGQDASAGRVAPTRAQIGVLDLGVDAISFYVMTVESPSRPAVRANAGATLEWTRRSLFAGLHELHDENRVVATLTYHGILRTTAVLESDESPRFTLRSSWTERHLTAKDDADTLLADYRGHWLGGGDLTVSADTTPWQWRPLSWTRRNWALFDEHVPVVQFRSRLALVKRRVRVSFSRDNLPVDRRMLLAAIGYFLVLAHRSRAH